MGGVFDAITEDPELQKALDGFNADRVIIEYTPGSETKHPFVVFYLADFNGRTNFRNGTFQFYITKTNLEGLIKKFEDELTGRGIKILVKNQEREFPELSCPDSVNKVIAVAYTLEGAESLSLSEQLYYMVVNHFHGNRFRNKYKAREY